MDKGFRIIEKKFQYKVVKFINNYVWSGKRKYTSACGWCKLEFKPGLGNSFKAS